LREWRSTVPLAAITVTGSGRFLVFRRRGRRAARGGALEAARQHAAPCDYHVCQEESVPTLIAFAERLQIQHKQ